jgi:hypothetical protein
VTDDFDLDDDDNASRVLEAIETLAAMGLVQDSGRRRDGQIVWEITKLGRVHGQDIISAAKKPKH